MYVNGYCEECDRFLRDECLCPENQPYLDYVHQSEQEPCNGGGEFVRALEALEKLQ